MPSAMQGMQGTQEPITSAICDVGVIVWDVAVPSAPSRLPGISMAGFRDLGGRQLDMQSVAHPAVTLAFEFGDSSLVIEDASGGSRRGAAAIGLAPGPLHLRGARVAVVQVRLAPPIARAVIGVAPAALTGRVVGADELWGHEAALIRARLDDARSWAHRFALVDDFLVRRARSRPVLNDEIGWAWRRIRATCGQVRIDDLATEVGWGRKRLWSRFGAQIGLTPKRAAMLVRFDAAAHRLASGVDAARVAADAGYVDQSHLHRDVVTFTGATPTTVAKAPFLAVDDVAWA